jgi:hypothetical protein
MKKLTLALAVFLFNSLAVLAQSTSVTLNVTDAGGQTWGTGSYRIVFVPNPQFPGATYSWTGGAFDPTTVYSGALDGTGSATFSIPSNSAINPIGTNWSLSVCPFATASCFSNTVAFNGTTQTLNFTPPAISISAAPGAVAYTDAEVKAGLGGIYYNTVSQLLRLCIVSNGGLCSSWVNVGGGSGPGGTPRLDQVTDPNVSKTFNLGTTTLAFVNGSLDLSNLTSALKLPVIAGCTVASNGQICYDSTLGNWVVFNVSQAVIPTLLSSGTYTTGDVLGVSNVAGKITLTDLGPINGTSGTSFVQITTTNILDGDTICWDSGTSGFINCTPGVPVTTITAASYLVDCGTDRGSYLLFTSASAIAVTLPRASTSGACDANFFTFIRTLHATLTVTPTTSSIDDGGGAGATLVMSPGYGFTITSDDTNYTARGGPYRESGNPLMSVEGFDVNTVGGYDWQSPNNASPGTILNKMACDDGTGKLQTCAFATAATNNPVGVAVTGIGASPGATGNTAICFIGFCKVIFDNSATANHFAQLSTTVNGDLHDTGSTTPPTNGQPYWYVFAGNSGAGTVATVRDLSPSELSAVSINGGGKSTIQINGVSTQPITNFTTSGGLTLTPTNSGNTTTVAFTLASSGISGLTTGQVPIAGSSTTLTSSKPLQGTDTNIFTSGTISGTGAALCTDALGGATTSGCSGGGVTTLTGDGSGYNNSASTGAVTLTKATQNPNLIAAGPSSSSSSNLVQKRDASGASGVTLAYATTPTAGDLLIAVVSTDSGGVTTVTGGGNTWTKAVGVDTLFLKADIFYTCNASGSATTVTPTWPGSPVVELIQIYEYSGNPTTSCLDTFGTAGANGGNTFTATTSGSVAQSTELVFANCTSLKSGNTTISVPPTYSILAATLNGNSNVTSAQLNSSTGLSGTQSVTCTTADPTPSSLLAIVATFKLTTSGSSVWTFRSLVNADLPLHTPSTVYANTNVAQTSAIADTVMATTSTSQLFRFIGTVNCTTTSAAATATLNLKYTDTGSTAQTVSVTDTCTALVTTGVPNLNVGLRVKAGTNITYGVTIANTPTYDVDVRLEQMN